MPPVDLLREHLSTRYWPYVEKGYGCWTWTGRLTSKAAA